MDVQQAPHLTDVRRVKRLHLELTQCTDVIPTVLWQVLAQLASFRLRTHRMVFPILFQLFLMHSARETRYSLVIRLNLTINLLVPAMSLMSLFLRENKAVFQVYGYLLMNKKNS